MENNIIDKENSKSNNSNISKEKNAKSQQSKIKEKSLTKSEIKIENKKDDEDDDFVLPVKTIKRSNSIKLYKKHQKDKEKKLSLKKESKKEVKNDDIFAVEENGTKRPNKSSKNVKQKKVVFLPNFVTIIDVESYKKYNEENTCKDPFENMEIINGRININNNDDEPDGKARVLCSCLIY